MTWLKNIEEKPNNIFLVHGEYSGQQALKNTINEELGINVVIPDYQETYSLDGELLESNVSKYKSTRFDILEMLSFLKEDVDNMTNKVKSEIKNNTDSNDLKVIFKELQVVKESLEKVKNISL